MGDQKGPDSHVVSTKILCACEFYVWYFMELKFEVSFKRLPESLDLCVCFKISNSRTIKTNSIGGITSVQWGDNISTVKGIQYIGG